MSKTILAEVDGFTPVIDTVVEDVGAISAIVFGRIWRYCQLSDGVCRASLEKIGLGVNLDKATVMRNAKILVDKGYLEDTTPELRNRPHIYKDTGKAGLSINIGVAQNNTGVAQSKATVAESKLKIDSKKELKDSSVSEKSSETGIPENPLVKTFDPDEVEKPQKRKNQNPNSRVNLLEPQTKGERILFGTLQAEIVKLHGPNWKVPTRFPSFACKELFAECEARLNGGLASAINAGVQKGIREVDNLVKYVNAVQPKEQPNSGARVTA